MRIPELKAANRSGAYRAGVLDVPTVNWLFSATTPWSTAYGTLPDWDRYYVPRNDAARLALDFDYPSAVAGLTFLENLLVVDTFVTRALLEGVIIADAVPETLQTFGATALTVPAVSSIVTDVAPRTCVMRPGWFTVNYVANSVIGSTATDIRVVRFPSYNDAGHMTTVTHAAEFRVDVAAFLSETLH